MKKIIELEGGDVLGGDYIFIYKKDLLKKNLSQYSDNIINYNIKSIQEFKNKIGVSGYYLPLSSGNYIYGNDYNNLINVLNEKNKKIEILNDIKNNNNELRNNFIKNETIKKRNFLKTEDVQIQRFLNVDEFKNLLINGNHVEIDKLFEFFISKINNQLSRESNTNDLLVDTAIYVSSKNIPGKYFIILLIFFFS